MSITTYASKLEELARQFSEHEITYEEYIAECDKLGEIEVCL